MGVDDIAVCSRDSMNRYRFPRQVNACRFDVRGWIVGKLEDMCKEVDEWKYDK